MRFPTFFFFGSRADNQPGERQPVTALAPAAQFSVNPEPEGKSPTSRNSKLEAEIHPDGSAFLSHGSPQQYPTSEVKDGTAILPLPYSHERFRGSPTPEYPVKAEPAVKTPENMKGWLTAFSAQGVPVNGTTDILDSTPAKRTVTAPIEDFVSADGNAMRKDASQSQPDNLDKKEEKVQGSRVTTRLRKRRRSTGGDIASNPSSKKYALGAHNRGLTSTNTTSCEESVRASGDQSSHKKRRGSAGHADDAERLTEHLNRDAAGLTNPTREKLSGANQVRVIVNITPRTEPAASSNRTDVSQHAMRYSPRDSTARFDTKSTSIQDSTNEAFRPVHSNEFMVTPHGQPPLNHVNTGGSQSSKAFFRDRYGRFVRKDERHVREISTSNHSTASLNLKRRRSSGSARSTPTFNLTLSKQAIQNSPDYAGSIGTPPPVNTFVQHGNEEHTISRKLTGTMKNANRSETRSVAPNEITSLVARGGNHSANLHNGSPNPLTTRKSKLVKHGPFNSARSSDTNSANGDSCKARSYPSSSANSHSKGAESKDVSSKVSPTPLQSQTISRSQNALLDAFQGKQSHSSLRVVVDKACTLLVECELGVEAYALARVGERAHIDENGCEFLQHLVNAGLEEVQDNATYHAMLARLSSWHKEWWEKAVADASALAIDSTSEEDCEHSNVYIIARKQSPSNAFDIQELPLLSAVKQHSGDSGTTETSSSDAPLADSARSTNNCTHLERAASEHGEQNLAADPFVKLKALEAQQAEESSRTTSANPVFGGLLTMRSGLESACTDAECSRNKDLSLQDRPDSPAPVRKYSPQDFESSGAFVNHRPTGAGRALINAHKDPADSAKLETGDSYEPASTTAVLLPDSSASPSIHQLPLPSHDSVQFSSRQSWTSQAQPGLNANRHTHDYGKHVDISDQSSLSRLPREASQEKDTAEDVKGSFMQLPLRPPLAMLDLHDGAEGEISGKSPARLRTESSASRQMHVRTTRPDSNKANVAVIESTHLSEPPVEGQCRVPRIVSRQESPTPSNSASEIDPFTFADRHADEREIGHRLADAKAPTLNLREILSVAPAEARCLSDLSCTQRLDRSYKRSAHPVSGRRRRRRRHRKGSSRVTATDDATRSLTPLIIHDKAGHISYHPPQADAIPQRTPKKHSRAPCNSSHKYDSSAGQSGGMGLSKLPAFDLKRMNTFNNSFHRLVGDDMHKHDAVVNYNDLENPSTAESYEHVHEGDKERQRLKSKKRKLREEKRKEKEVKLRRKAEKQMEEQKQDMTQDEVHRRQQERKRRKMSRRAARSRQDPAPDRNAVLLDVHPPNADRERIEVGNNGSEHQVAKAPRQRHEEAILVMKQDKVSKRAPDRSYNNEENREQARSPSIEL